MLPYGENPFVSQVILQKVNSQGEPLEVIHEGTVDVTAEHLLSMRAGEGTYLRIELKLPANLPDTYADELVQPYQNWPVTLVVFPRNSPRPEQMVPIMCFPSGDGKPVLGANANLVPDRSGRQMPPLLQGSTNNCCRSCGYVGPIQLVSQSADEFSFSTYLNALDEKTRSGDYTYEVRVHPCARWTSKVRSKLGPIVVVFRGQVSFQG